MGVVTRSSLCEADIFLYRGTDWISRGILLIDGGTYSHAGLYMGPAYGPGDRVSEAVSAGIVERDVGSSIQGKARVSDFRLLGGPQNLSPVTARAQVYTQGGYKYAYLSIVFLAFLCLTRRCTATRSFGPMLRALLDRAAAKAMAALQGGRKCMICSEFVTRCYTEPYASPVMRCVGAPAPEAGSLLALLLSPELAATIRPPSPRSVLKVAQPEETLLAALDMDGADDPLDRQAADLFQAYQQEVDQGQGEVRLSLHAFPQLWGAVERLAYHLLGTLDENHPARSAHLQGQPYVLLRALAALTPQFVTPRDLENCADLSLQGDLVFPEW